MWWFEKKFVPEQEYDKGSLYHTSLNKVTLWATAGLYSSLLALNLLTPALPLANNIILAVIAPVFARLIATDLKYQLLLNVYVFPLILIGLLYSFITPALSILDSVMGMTIAGGSLLLLNSLLSMINNKNNIGGGDIKFCFAAGAFIGLTLLPYFFWFSFFLALLMHPLLKAENKYISFGPALIFSLWILLCIHNYFY